MCKSKAMTEEEILKIAEQLQHDLHSTVNAIIKEAGKQVSYQDAVNTWLILQLAKLKYALKTEESIFNAAREIDSSDEGTCSYKYQSVEDWRNRQ